MPTLPLYQRDAYCTSARVTVCSCVASEDDYLVTFDDTLFYATGGGQPHDRGEVGGARVLDVFRDEAGAIQHRLDAPLVVGAEVTQQLDWARRFDHMQQHTAQHLITALALQQLGAPTVSFHLGESYAAIELELAPDGLDAHALEVLERAVNAAIRADLEVAIEAIAPDEAEARIARGAVRSRGVPDGVTGPVRLVSIAGVDVNTCGGTHVQALRELQMVKLLPPQRARGRVRLPYLAGDRVRARLGESIAREGRLTALLSGGPEEHEALIVKAQEHEAATSRTLRHVHHELAELLGRGVAEARRPIATLHRAEVDMAFLGAIADAFAERCDELGREDLLLITAGDPMGAGVFVLRGPVEVVRALGPEVAAALDGRGGGKPGTYQGKAGSLRALPKVARLLRAAVD